MKHPFRELLGDCFQIAGGLLVIWIFWTITVRGSWLQENILLIRNGELIAGIVMLVLGIERLIDDLRK